MRVLSPVGERRRFAEKNLGSNARGRTIGLVNNGFGDKIAGMFFARLQELLSAEPGVNEVRVWRKPLFTRPSPEQLIDEVAAASHQAVVGLCA
ncbi:MAG: hypothetical protein HYZ72_02650 [Deltaproteobacteria bacterium]|nr:hypothetical protein [Deltaproteobacteria bacterium]